MNQTGVTLMTEDIPKGWRRGKLSELVHSPESGGRPKGGASSETGKIPSIGAEFITRDGRLNYDGMKFIPEEYFINMNSGKLKDGDILICKDGALTGKVAFYENSPYNTAAVNEHVFILRPNNGDCRKFIFYSLQSDAGQNKIKKIMTGSAQPGINTTFPKYYDLLIPTKKEQEKISDILSTIDENLFETGKIIDECKHIKIGLMQTLLTKGIPSRHTKFKKTELGEIPENWEVKKLIDIAPLQRGFDLPSHMLKDGQYPVCYSNGISNHHSEFKVKGPGVFTGRSGTIGNVFYVEKDFWPHNTALWVTDFCNNYPKYIYYMYIYLKLDKFDAGTSVPTLNRNDVHNHKIAIPPLSEQKEIVLVLENLDLRIKNEQDKRYQLENLKKSLMQKLLSGEIRVRV